jgi:hypothetical protein
MKSKSSSLKNLKPAVSDAWYPQGGGEPYAAVAERAGIALNKVAGRYPGQEGSGRDAQCRRQRCGLRSHLQTPIESIFHVDVAPCSITTIKIWPSDGLMALMSMSERAESVLLRAGTYCRHIEVFKDHGRCSGALNISRPLTWLSDGALADRLYST